MPKMIYICILLIYFKVISKKGGHYCPRLPYVFSLFRRRCEFMIVLIMFMMILNHNHIRQTGYPTDESCTRFRFAGSITRSGHFMTR